MITCLGRSDALKSLCMKTIGKIVSLGSLESEDMQKGWVCGWDKRKKSGREDRDYMHKEEMKWELQSLQAN